MAGNLLLRASWALVVLALLMSGLDAYLPGPSAGGQLVNLHLLFNAALLLLGLPLVGPVSALMKRLVRKPPTIFRSSAEILDRSTPAITYP